MAVTYRKLLLLTYQKLYFSIYIIMYQKQFFFVLGLIVWVLSGIWAWNFATPTNFIQFIIFLFAWGIAAYFMRLILTTMLAVLIARQQKKNHDQYK
jgi:hypothetical protein